MTIKPFYLDLSSAEIDELSAEFKSILQSGQLILSKHTAEFEDKFANYIGARHAVSLNTATTGLELLCILNDFRDRKVAVPSNTNFASVAAIIKAGGIPVYMDIDPNSFNCGLNNLKNVHKKYNITAAMFVHIGGIISSDFPEMVEYCQQNNIVLLRIAHAHGSRLNGINAGNFGSGGAFSFPYQGDDNHGRRNGSYKQ